jgi:hypothetical protein
MLLVAITASSISNSKTKTYGRNKRVKTQLDMKDSSSLNKWENTMSLRFPKALITGAALAVSSQAHIASAHTSPITIEAVARVEAIFTSCAAVDPGESAKYHQALSNILYGHPDSEIEADKNTSRYAFAFKFTDTEIAKLPVSTIVSSCKNFLAGK